MKYIVYLGVGTFDTKAEAEMYVELNYSDDDFYTIIKKIGEQE